MLFNVRAVCLCYGRRALTAGAVFVWSGKVDMNTSPFGKIEKQSLSLLLTGCFSSLETQVFESCCFSWEMCQNVSDGLFAVPFYHQKCYSCDSSSERLCCGFVSWTHVRRMAVEMLVLGQELLEAFESGLRVLGVIVIALLGQLECMKQV